MKVLIALEALNKTKANEDEVHKVLKEITGEEIKEALEVTQTDIKYSDGYYYYGDATAEIATKDPVKAICLNTSNLKYSKGIYSVNCVYVHTRNADYENNKIEELPKFETIIEFKINKEYEYSKFCMLNSNDFISNPYESIQDDEENNESVNPENIDNYASTMVWNDFFTPGLRGKIPAGWNIREFITTYSGEKDEGKLAKSVSGVAIGINKETNEIVKSNVIINFYTPEFIDKLNTMDYTRVVASRYNMEASEAGFTSHEGMDWNMVVEPNNNRQFYCHLEPLYGGKEGIGYVVEIICDNYENYKVTNIINWMFGNLKGASF